MNINFRFLIDNTIKKGGFNLTLKIESAMTVMRLLLSLCCLQLLWGTVSTKTNPQVLLDMLMRLFSYLIR